MREFSPEGVLDAIRSGRTYASEGPEVHALEIGSDGRLVISCSPSAVCHLRSEAGIYGGVSSFAASEGVATRQEFTFDLAQCGYRLHGSICIILEDTMGRRAWMSPMRVDFKLTDATEG